MMCLAMDMKNDYFAISYDNTDAPNVGNVDDKVHSGGYSLPDADR